MLEIRLPLDDALAEIITIPFHDHILSSAFTPILSKSKHNNVRHETSWCSTNIHWEKLDDRPESITFFVPALISLQGYDTLLLAVSLPQQLSIQLRPQYHESRATFCRWSSPVKGSGERMEVEIPLSRLYAPGTYNFLNRKPLCGITFRLHAKNAGVSTTAFSWVGLRNSVIRSSITTHRQRRNMSWSSWIMPEEHWEKRSFDYDLLFSAMDLQNAQAKKENKSWRAHFKYLEEHAQKFLTRDPERDYGIYLPNHDKRYIRAADHGKMPYHWEALTLAFVGLVNDDKRMLRHALRYLMCMIHTRYWADSMEQRSPSSTWNQRSFMEEMTTVSVALLADWLAFALPPHTKALINQALWDRGISPVRRDLIQFDYMHSMNQGIVFNRACIIGGLYLEKSWPRMRPLVDAAYQEMKVILNKYIQPDGGVAEGPGYFCQAANGALWAIITYCRARNLDWKTEASAIFSNVDKFVRAMSSTEAIGSAIPAGDCRTNWYGGDVVPILAQVFPNSAFASMLRPCLINGSVFMLTGTLTRSGGMIGMIYGPNEPAEPAEVVPTFINLPESAKVSSFRKNEDLHVRLFLTGCSQSKAHSHRDLGSFVLEVNNHCIFSDRGMVEYWRTAVHQLAKTFFHNTVTPSLEGVFPDQEVAPDAVIPSATGDESHLQAKIDLSSVWQKYMRKYVRTIQSYSINLISITDDIDLVEPGRIAFHLHSKYKMVKEGCNLIIEFSSFKCRVECKWAEQLLIDLDNNSIDARPMYRFAATSSYASSHQLLSTIYIEKIN